MESYDLYEFVAGPLCGLQVALGEVPDGSNFFMEVPGGKHPDQIITQAQYCLKLSELKLFFVSAIPIRKPPRQWSRVGLLRPVGRNVQYPQ